MRIPFGFLLRINKAAKKADEEAGMTSIIIRQPYADLEEELRNTFERQEDVRVLVERRRSERRTTQQPVAMDRRRADRRRRNEELVNIVIST